MYRLEHQHTSIFPKIQQGWTGVGKLDFVGFLWYNIIMGQIPKSASGVMAKSVELYGLQYVTPYHRELARRIVLGATRVSLCEEFNITPTRLSIITESPLFKRELMRLEEMRDQGVADVTQTLRDISPLAVDILERTMYKTKSDSLKVNIAKDILDRAGHGAITKAVVDVVSRKAVGYEDLSLEEKRRLLSERIEKMNELKLQREAEDEKAKAISVEFECIEVQDDACSASERALAEGFTNVD